MHLLFWTLLALLTPSLLAQTTETPLFNGITLEEFGAFTNLNVPLQTDERFNPNQPLRTNDFQPLQQLAALDQQIIRMGTFLVSQSSAGPALTLPSYKDETNLAISLPSDATRMTFSSTQATSFNRISNLLTTQAFTITYFPVGNATPDLTTDPADPISSLNTITDYQIYGNPYHDLYYNTLTPVITLENATISRVFVDDVEVSLLGRFLPSGSKWRFILTTTLADGRTGQQTLLLYLEESAATISWTLSVDLTTLTAFAPLTGFLRVATIQTSSLPNSPSSTDTTLGEDWATAIINQTLPSTPIAMYMLWPQGWTTRVGDQILLQIAEDEDLPTCEFIPDLLPVLARTRQTQAEFLARQIPSFEYGFESNPFLTQFLILAAGKLSGEIASYQSSPPTPCSSSFPAPPPPYFLSTIAPNATTTEEIFDQYRSILPISADVTFAENLVTWEYTCFGGAEGPLILFPIYHILEGTRCPSSTSSTQELPLNGFAYLDPVKGPYLAQVATENSISFVERPVPTWYAPTNPQPLQQLLFPPQLQFTRSELGTLTNLFITAQLNQVTQEDLLGVGKELFKMAFSALAMNLVIEQSGAGRGTTLSAAGHLISQVKSTLTSWLVTKSADGAQLPDFFASDLLTGGICASAGMGLQSDSVETVDEGNAIYSNHHYQYGYWLGAAGMVVIWDELFNTSNPFIATQVTTTTGTSVPIKQFVDMLMRDARNPDKNDPELPFNRYGYPFEGHSTQNGMLYTPSAEGRIAERFGEDFNSWAMTNLYARAILACTALDESEKIGFSTLETFTRTNMALTASAGELVYHDNNWIYSGAYAVNETVGNVFDSETSATTTSDPGTPSCTLYLP